MQGRLSQRELISGYGFLCLKRTGQNCLRQNVFVCLIPHHLDTGRSRNRQAWNIESGQAEMVVVNPVTFGRLRTIITRIAEVVF